MACFEDVRKARGLREYARGPSGTLHLDHASPVRDGETTFYRHFDGNLSPSLIPAYALLTRTAQAWVEARDELATVIEVASLVDVGEDYVARPFHVLGHTLFSYDFPDEEDPAPIPEELEVMRAWFRRRLDESQTASDRLVGRILAHSLLEPSKSTHLGPGERFIVAEVNPTPDELEAFARLYADRLAP